MTDDENENENENKLDRSLYFKQRTVHARWFPTLREILENHNVELGSMLGPLELKRLDEMYKDLAQLEQEDDDDSE